MTNLLSEFGQIDIYLFDQILRGRIGPRDRIVDVGCGFGRNLVYFLRHRWDAYGIDPDPDAVEATRRTAAELDESTRVTDRFRVEPVERSTLPDEFATVVISSAVLHFARDDRTFEAMLTGTWRLLAPGGMLFCRLASSIGMEALVRPLASPSSSDAGTVADVGRRAEAGPLEPRAGGEGRRYRLPDGTDRYLVDEADLMAWTRRLGGQLLDPLKTTVVQGQRAMTTWVVRRDGKKTSGIFLRKT